jgi:hypothetical protein
MRAFPSAFLALLVLAASISGSLAGEIRKGAIMQVKADSIWFQDGAKLTHWQKLKKSGQPAALASYQDRVLARREAWQFSGPLTVKILSPQPAANRVRVEMTTEGRLRGSKWLLDASALAL